MWRLLLRKKVSLWIGLKLLLCSNFKDIYTLKKKEKEKNTQSEYFTPVLNHKEGAMPPQTMYFNQIYTDVVLARARWFLN